MNKDQRDAIDRCITEMSSELPADLFLSYLVVNKIFSVAEQKLVQKSASDDMAVFSALEMLKSKSGGWECLMKFIANHGYGSSWVADLKKCDSPKTVHQAGLAAFNIVIDSKGSFGDNDKRKLAMDSLMTDLQRVLSGGIEPFVTHPLPQTDISALETFISFSE